MPISATDLNKAYLAYFGRPADFTGKTFFAAQEQADVIKAFDASAESMALYGSDSTAKINAIYQNLFNRDAEPAGLQYWATLIQQGRVTPAGAAFAILNGAQGTDATSVTNKLAASDAFVAALDTTPEIVGYSGLSAGASARAFLKTVDATPASLTAAQAAVATAVANATGTGTGGSNEAGSDYVLTTAQDAVTGTAKNDFFRAVAGVQVGSQDQTTLNSSDIIDGSGGNDTLVVNMTGADYRGGARIKGIETLQIGTNLPGATFDYNVNQGQNEITDVTKIVYDQINVGEALTVNNILKTGADLPVISWVNEAGSRAGTANVNYRTSAVAGTDTNQAIDLQNVLNGTLNIGAGVEKFTVTSGGSTANTLIPGVNVDGSAGVDLISASEDGVANNGALATVIVNGAQAFGKAAEVVTTAGANAGLTNRAVGTDGGFVNETANTASNLISVAATVTEVDATANTGGVNIRFTPRVNAAEVNVTFKGSEANDYVEFEVGNVNATGGKGNDTFAFLNNQFNSTFTTLDTIAGGEGTDTIQLGVNGTGSYNVDWTEFNGKTGIDVLDIRGANNNVTLSDAFVLASDAGLTVRTDKIVQTSATSVANPTGGSKAEDDSQTTLNLTKLNANRAVVFEGGSGSDRIIGNEASITSAVTLKGGANVANTGFAVAGDRDYDTLTIVDSAVLSRGDLQNVSGFEGLVLVKSDTAAARTFSIEVTEAFLTNNSAAANSAATNLNDSIFTIATGAAGGSNALTAVDIVNIDLSDLYTAANVYKASLAGRSIDVSSIIAAVTAANVRFTVNGQQFTSATLPSAATVLSNDAVTQAAVVASAGLTSGSGGGSGGVGGGVGGAAGTTFTLTAANAILTTTASANATPAGTFLSGSADTINAGTLLSGVFISDATAGDGDVLNGAIVGAALAGAPSISGIETINLTTNMTAAASVAGITGATGGINVSGGAANFSDAQGKTFGLTSGYAAKLDVSTTANNVGTVTVNVNGSVAGSSIDAVTTGNDAALLALVVNAASTLNSVVSTTATTISGSGALTVGSFTGGTVSAATSTGSLTVTDVGLINITGSNQADTFGQTTAASSLLNGGGGNDTFNFGALFTVADTIDGGAGMDTLNISGIAAADLAAVTNVENVVVSGAVATTVTTAAANLGLGETLTINGSAMTAGLTTAGGLSAIYKLNITGSSTVANALVGGAQADTIVGGAGNDTITGGAGADDLTGGLGNDTFNYAVGAASVIGFADVGAVTTAVAPGAGDTFTGTEVIRDLVTGDTVNLGHATIAADAGVVGTLQANEYLLVSGTYAGNVFTVGGANTSTLVIYDADSATAGVQQEAIVLVGVTAAEAGAIVNTAGVLSAFGA